MKRHWAYFKYIIRHKWYVFWYGLMFFGVNPFRALFHDMSKFHPAEWFTYANTFYNPDGSVKEYADSDAFKYAWNRHQKRNKHHWQYWVLIFDRGEKKALPMPEKYIREMVADWAGAEAAISNTIDPMKWYQENREKMIMNIETHVRVFKIIQDFNLQVYEGLKL